MKRRQALRGIVVFTLTLLQTGASAQSGARRTLIGLLDAGERREWWDAFRQRLRELGYVEGQNVSFEQRYAKGKLELLPTLANELVQAKVAIIVTGGATAAVAAQRASRKIPIVMASGTDQVSLGLASSLARPGSNVTGVSSLNSDLMVKRFELLHEAVPKLSRLAVLWHADNTPSMASVRDLEGAAARSRIGFESLGIRNADELADAFARMTRERCDGLVVVNSALPFAERKKIADLALKQKIPAMYGAAEFAEAGGLMSYAPSYPEMFRRAANYVDKILRGANPADMPIEQPTTFEFVINAKAAKSLGFAIPASIMARADRVIQ